MQVQLSCVVFHVILSLRKGQGGPSHDTETRPNLPPKEFLYQVVNGTMSLRHWAWGTYTFLPPRCN